MDRSELLTCHILTVAVTITALEYTNVTTASIWTAIIPTAAAAITDAVATRSNYIGVHSYNYYIDTTSDYNRIILINIHSYLYIVFRLRADKGQPKIRSWGTNADTASGTAWCG